MKYFTLILFLPTILFSCSSDEESTTQSDENSTPPCNSTTAIVDVTNPITGRTWMDRNLGASQVATSSTDANSFGDLYQWGRLTDGHNCNDSAITSTTSSTDQPGHSDFIAVPTGSNPLWDWRSPQNANLWQGVNGVNNPCPDGYRLPTEAEWEAERQTWSTNNAFGAFNSQLKLPMPGKRHFTDGTINNEGAIGAYWSSTVNGTNSTILSFSINVDFISSNRRANGLSVRCIKD